jgi:beta-glucanase (GH16 family)
MLKFRVFAAASAVLAAALGACSDDAEPTSGSSTGARAGTAGTKADAAAGMSGAASGGAAGSSGGNGGNQAGGTSSGGSGGSGGPSTGGAAGAEGGSAGSAGSGASAGSAGSGASAGSAGAAGTAGAAGSAGSPGNGWTQVWADEFDGTSIDSSKWGHEVDCWGGGNGEDQCYVTAAKNSFVRDGFLHIVALKDRPSGATSPTDPTVVTKGHSSARLRTLGKGDWKYGRIEARMKLPFGKGLWPAFWMLPTDRVYGGWAASGEIDVMEAINLKSGPNEVHGTLHYGGAWPANVHTGTNYRPPSNVWENFYTYAVEWEEGEFRWFVDQKHYATQTKWRTTAAAAFPAPFDQKFHIILNVAVGGQWPGPPDGTTTFPQELVVDYVRVYACSTDRATGKGCGTRDPAIRPL